MTNEIHRRPVLPCSAPELLIQVTDDGSRTLMERESGNTFHSSAGAKTETEHVYLNNSGVADRLSCQQNVSVLEIGLGTGLGMLMTVERAIQCGATLQIETLETSWLSAAVISELQLEREVDAALLADYLSFREKQSAAKGEQYRWSPAASIAVTINLTPVESWIPRGDQRFDAIYFDPFAPDAAPDLWTVPIFEKLNGCLSRDGKLVTYCVSRLVRDRLVEAGLCPQVVKGPPGGKRNSLVVVHCVD